MAKDFYKILGVPRNASKDDIKRAYRTLAHQFHPDKSGGNESKFKEINEAYQVLGDERKRAQYDQFGAAFGGGQGPFGGGFDWSQAGFGGFSPEEDRKSTRLNSSHSSISYAVFCLKKKTKKTHFRCTISFKRGAGHQNMQT